MDAMVFQRQSADSPPALFEGGALEHRCALAALLHPLAVTDNNVCKHKDLRGSQQKPEGPQALAQDIPCLVPVARTLRRQKAAGLLQLARGARAADLPQRLLTPLASAGPA
mmetsp:Transcript_61521/g.107729  ORF Transcript_61521/g.107729 Transcript_61521/m.107729 type:complete len:111 (+) Transcript_61521:678-1010(+)